MLFYEDNLLSQITTDVIRQQSCTARDSLSKAKLNTYSLNGSYLFWFTFSSYF